MPLEDRKPPLGNHGWISSPERRETATISHSLHRGISMKLTEVTIESELCQCLTVEFYMTQRGEVKIDEKVHG